MGASAWHEEHQDVKKLNQIIFDSSSSLNENNVVSDPEFPFAHIDSVKLSTVSPIEYVCPREKDIIKKNTNMYLKINIII